LSRTTCAVSEEAWIQLRRTTHILASANLTHLNKIEFPWLGDPEVYAHFLTFGPFFGILFMVLGTFWKGSDPGELSESLICLFQNFQIQGRLPKKENSVTTSLHQALIPSPVILCAYPAPSSRYSPFDVVNTIPSAGSGGGNGR